MNTKLDFALAYIARGWAIFPADSSGAKKSHKSAKYSNGVPWGATTDADQIRIDFNEWPGCGIGIVTGRTSGIFVTEIDTKEDHGVDGIASLHALQIQYGELPVTLTAESPSGSRHYYWKYPDNITIKNSASRIGPGIDVRGDGGI